MPNVPATPMFKNKGEIYAAGHINTKGNLSVNLGTSINSHIAIIANGSTVNSGRNSNDYFRQQLAEAGLGYFTQFGENKQRVLEFYAGYGVGKTKDFKQRASVYGYEITEARDMDFNKIFIQLNFSSTRKKKINIFGDRKELNYGTVVRLSRVNMNNLSINNEIMVSTENNYFIEPLFFTRMQLMNGLQLQYTNGFNIGVKSNEYLKAGNSVFTLGVVYTFKNK